MFFVIRGFFFLFDFILCGIEWEVYWISFVVNVYFVVLFFCICIFYVLILIGSRIYV